MKNKENQTKPTIEIIMSENVSTIIIKQKHKTNYCFNLNLNGAAGSFNVVVVHKLLLRARVHSLSQEKSDLL